MGLCEPPLLYTNSPTYTNLCARQMHEDTINTDTQKTILNVSPNNDSTVNSSTVRPSTEPTLCSPTVFFLFWPTCALYSLWRHKVETHVGRWVHVGVDN